MDLVEKGLFEQILGKASFEMALPRKTVISRIESLSEPIVEHLIKIVVYGKTLGEEVYSHWKYDEIANYFFIIDGLEVKESGKLRPAGYLSALISNQGNSAFDYYSKVVLFRISNRRSGQYPDFNPTKEQGEKVFEVYFNLLKEICPLLSNKTKKDFNSLIDIVLEKVNL